MGSFSSATAEESALRRTQSQRTRCTPCAGGGEGREVHSHLVPTFLQLFRLIRACVSLSLCVLYFFCPTPLPPPLPLRCRTTGQWLQRGMPGTGDRASGVCAGCSPACARTRSLRSEGWTAEGEWGAVQRLLRPLPYRWSFGLFVDRSAVDSDGEN